MILTAIQSDAVFSPSTYSSATMSAHRLHHNLTPSHFEQGTVGAAPLTPQQSVPRRSMFGLSSTASSPPVATSTQQYDEGPGSAGSKRSLSSTSFGYEEYLMEQHQQAANGEGTYRSTKRKHYDFSDDSSRVPKKLPSSPLSRSGPRGKKRTIYSQFVDYVTEESSDSADSSDEFTRESIASVFADKLSLGTPTPKRMRVQVSTPGGSNSGTDMEDEIEDDTELFDGLKIVDASSGEELRRITDPKELRRIYAKDDIDEDGSEDDDSPRPAVPLLLGWYGSSPNTEEMPPIHVLDDTTRSSYAKSVFGDRSSSFSPPTILIGNSGIASQLFNGNYSTNSSDDNNNNNNNNSSYQNRSRIERLDSDDDNDNDDDTDEMSESSHSSMHATPEPPSLQFDVDDRMDLD